MSAQTSTPHNGLATVGVAQDNSTQLFVDLQATLAKRYDIHQPYSVGPFISHDAEALAKITGETLTAPELLLVQEDGSNLDITVFLDKQVISAVLDLQWDQHWNGKHFSDYCIVLEGISHFVYLSWSAYYDRPVRPLELELQAEIDKFIFAALEAQPANLADLNTRLFENVQYRPNLSAENRHRYQTANNLAQQYCLWLTTQFDLERPGHRLRAELARFYRFGGQNKIQHITDRLH